MAFLVGADKISLQYPGKVIFDEASFSLNTGDRIGVVGANGEGKSSLLKLLAKEISPDSGRILHTNNTTFSHLKQHDDLDEELSVTRNIFALSPEYVWASNPKIRAILNGLIADINWEEKVKNLSGGQRRRVDLCKVLVGDYDLILLDEPTNHLDIQTVNWLARHLKNRWSKGNGALLVVSHDRWFLDFLALDMWEVHDGKVEHFEGGYSAYIQQRAERQELALKAEAKRQNFLRKELYWLSRVLPDAAKKPRFRIDAAKEMLAKDPPPRNALELKSLSVSRLGKQVITFKHVSKSIGSKLIFDDVNFDIKAGDRIGL
ncbi:MAG: ATP-binding cassette domain-containing protein, partial [Coriobacteriia bacterium]|nr:ATP-binding cassette domain-containing protein [Coriobacteriia bacterium]